MQATGGKSDQQFWLGVERTDREGAAAQQGRHGRHGRLHMRRAKNGSPSGALWTEFFFCGPPVETTAWLTMQSEANGLADGSPCNLRCAGRFSVIAGRAGLFLSNFLLISACCREFSLSREQGAFLVFAGKSSVELRMWQGGAE